MGPESIVFVVSMYSKCDLNWAYVHNMITKDGKKIGEEKKIIIFLFSLDSYDFWPILMANLLLHDFLHIFIYDAAKRAHVVQCR